MKNLFILSGLLLFSLTARTQNIYITGFGGTASYQGDLIETFTDFRQSNAAFGFGINYEITEKLIGRASFTFGKVEGHDRFSPKTYLQPRNLSFQSNIQEFHIGAEYHIFNLYDKRFTLYGFIGLGVFHFNPYTIDAGNQKVYLKPLSTEGQGLSEYPDRKPYSLIQMNIPLGGGVKFALNDNIRVGLEIGMRKLFTDYLDDVSEDTYVDRLTLLNAKGPKAVELYYRGNEVPGGNPFPPVGDMRGYPGAKDLYSFNGLNISFRLGSGSGLRSGGGFRKSKMGCPPVPL